MASLHGRGSISPDGNKENVQTNNTSGEDTEESDSEKATANKEEMFRQKSPFTALNPKQKKIIFWWRNLKRCNVTQLVED